MVYPMTLYDPLVFGGNLIGCYVYMAMCADGDQIHIKIGMSQDPQKRIVALANNSPLVIECLAIVSLQSRQRAAKLERDLHDALAKWRTNGEWFKFSTSDKAEFNRLQGTALDKYQSPSRKLKWAKLNVREIMKSARARQRYAQSIWGTRGKSYRDAVSSGLKSS